MPPAGAGVAVAGAAAASAGTGAAAAGTVTAATLATQAAIGFGLSAVSFAVQNFVLKDKGTFGNSNERNYQANGTSTETYLPVIYGEAKIGINRVFLDTDPANKDWLYVVGAFAHGKIKRVRKIYADDEVIAVYNEKKKKWVVDDEYTGLVGTIQVNRGGDNAKHFSFVGNKFDAWSDDKRGRGVASIAFALKADSDKFPGGIPNITLIVKGNARVYDPRDGVEKYTDNFALCYLDALRNKRYGNAVPDNEIDFDNFSAMANYSDEWIEGDPIEAAIKCKPKIKTMDCKLEKDGVYNYKVCATSSWTYSEPDFQGQTVSSSTALSSASQITISSKKGRVSLTLTPSATNQESVDKLEIYRTTAGGSTYYLAKEIDYDYEDAEQELTFIDNLSDEDLIINKPYEGVGWTEGLAPGVPSIAATYTAYSSNLDLNKYYRYKIVYGKSSTVQYVQGGVRSKAIKTKKGKKFIRLNSIPTSDDNNVDVRVIYRTVGMDNATDDEDDNSNYKYLYTIDDNDETEEYLDTLADGSLGVGGGADSNPYGFPATCPSVATLTSGQQRRHTVNGIMDTSKTALQNLEEMLMGAVAKSHFEGGKWRLDIKRPTVAEQITINRDNVIGDWTFNLPGADVLCNYVKAAFINPKANYQTDYVVFPPKRNLNQYLIDDNRFENVKEIDLPYINDRRKAQIMAMITRGLARQGITATLKVKEELLKVRVGSVVKAELDTPGWDGKKFWVEGFSVGMDYTNYVTLREYNADAFDRQYLEADAPDDTDTSLPDATEPPEEVSGVVIVEQEYLDNYSTNWRLKVTFTNPDSPFWSHSDVYIKRGVDAEYYYDQKISKDNNGVFYIQPIEAFTTYYLQILSVSTLGVSMHLNNEDGVEDDWEATVHEYTVEIDPPAWKDFGIELLGRSGNNGVAYGPDFVFRWKPYGGSNTGKQVESSRNSLGITKASRHMYYVQIYHDYPANTVVGQVKISTTLAASFFTAETIGRYTLSDNIENSKTLFEGILKESSSGTVNWKDKTYAVNTNVKNAQTYYGWYWGKGYPDIRVKVSVIDEYNQMSVSSEEITFTNPRPLMELEITSSLGAKSKVMMSLIDSLNKGGSILNTKSGAEVSFRHPDKEYDITHFYLKYFRIGEWFANCAYAVKDLILVNNKVYECYQAGTSGSTIPAELSNGNTGSVYTDNTAKWIDGEGDITAAFEDTGDLLFTTKITSATRINVSDETSLNTEVITSLVNVNSSDNDVTDAYYCKEIKQLDPKYYYLIGVVPLDVFGKTVAVANYAWGWAKPGLTEDDDENEIEAPGIPNLAGISEPLSNSPISMYDGTNVNRLRMTWKNEDTAGTTYTDLKNFVIQFYGIAKPDAVLGDFPATETLIGDAIDNGYVTISGLNYIFTLEEVPQDQASGTKTRAYLQNVTDGTMYYARVKAVNTSGQSSGWTTITADTMEAIEGDLTGIVMFSSTTPYSATTLTITQLSETIKIEVEIADPPDDLWGVKFAVKESAFTGTVSDATGKANRTANKVAEIAAKDGKAVYYHSGSTGTNYYISIMPIDNSKNDATIEGVVSWKDADANPYTVNGIGHESLGTSFKKFKYAGSITSSAYNKLSWTNAQLKIKGQSGSPFTVSAATNQTIAGTMVLYWIGSATTSFALVDYDDFYTDSAYDDALAIAWVEVNSDTNQKAVIIPMQGDDFSISSSMISANAVAAGHIQAGSVTATKMSVTSLSAITAEMGTLTSGVVALPSGTPRIYIDGNSSPARIKISKTGYHAGTALDPDYLIFDSYYNYFKIIESDYSTVNFTYAGGVSDGSIYNDDVPVSLVDTGTKTRSVVSFIGVAAGYVFPLPYTEYNTATKYEIFTLLYDDSTTPRQLIARRTIVNHSGASWTPGADTRYIRWYLLAETIT